MRLEGWEGSKAGKGVLPISMPLRTTFPNGLRGVILGSFPPRNKLHSVLARSTAFCWDGMAVLLNSFAPPRDSITFLPVAWHWATWEAKPGDIQSMRPVAPFDFGCCAKRSIWIENPAFGCWVECWVSTGSEEVGDEGKNDDIDR